MQQEETEKLLTIAAYLDAGIPDSQTTIQPFSSAFLFFVLTVRTAKKLYALKVARSLIEDRNVSVSEIKRLMVRDDLPKKLQASKGEYVWNPIPVT